MSNGSVSEDAVLSGYTSLLNQATMASNCRHCVIRNPIFALICNHIGRFGNIPEKGQGQRVVLQFTDFLSGYVCHIYMDNFFHKLQLARSLLSRQLSMTGTIQRNKPELPLQIMPDSYREQFSSIFGFQKNTTIVSYVPKKNKAVIHLTTNHNEVNVSTNESRKPKMILDRFSS